MADLENFKSKNFVEQIQLLNDLGNKTSTPETIQELCNLFTEPLGDKPVDAMVKHILSDLLSKNEIETVKRLISANTDEKKLALQLVARHKFQSAVSNLIKLSSEEEDLGILQEIFITMSELKSPEFLNIFRSNINHYDEVISALSIKMVGEFKDSLMLKKLFKIVKKSEEPDRYQVCTVPTAQALETLSLFGTNEVIVFFLSKLHHKNPTVRRIIQEQLIEIGSKVVPFISKIFDGYNIDDKIMASNLLGQLGDRAGGEIMLDALDKGNANDPNVKFAIYEALGNIRFMKGLICLIDGLEEEDLILLICVITSLNQQLNSFVLESIRGRILKGDAQSQRILKAICISKSLDIFEGLYMDPEFDERLIGAISDLKDPEIISAFIEKLETIDGKHKNEHLKRLNSLIKKKAAISILIIDDSKTMLSFYRSVLANDDFSIVSAENGEEALNLIKSQEPFNLIITDMNMPVMDGIELTRNLKRNTMWKDIPVIMSTTESDHSQKKLASDVGINDFITKPIIPQVLLQKVNEFLKKYSSKKKIFTIKESSGN